MTSLDQIDAAVAHLKRAVGEGPQLALVLGSGLSPFADRLENAKTVSYHDIPHWAASSVEGHRGELVVGELHGTRIAAMAGRIHLYEGYEPREVTFPVRVLARWGATTLFVTNSAGGISGTLEAGDLMLITDHINMQAAHPLIGPNDDALGPRFPDMSHAYDPGLLDLARKAAKTQGVALKEGVYVALSGPSYETPAEVRMLATLGADAVGMSTVPEVIVARHMGVRVLGISCISNLAAGISDTPLSHDEVTETAARVRKTFEGLVNEIISLLGTQ